jgi:hypothetical protein
VYIIVDDGDLTTLNLTDVSSSSHGTRNVRLAMRSRIGIEMKMGRLYSRDRTLLRTLFTYNHVPREEQLEPVQNKDCPLSEGRNYSLPATSHGG